MESLAKYHEAEKKGRLNGLIVREHRQWAKNELKSPTGKSPNRLQCNTWAVSSAVRASGLHPEGPAFKSLTAPHRPFAAALKPIPSLRLSGAPHDSDIRYNCVREDSFDAYDANRNG